MTQTNELISYKVLQINKLVVNNKQQEINFESDLGKVIFVVSQDESENYSNRLDFLKCLSGIKNPVSGNILYKQMNVHNFKTSYFKRGRVFIDENINYCFNKSLLDLLHLSFLLNFLYKIALLPFLILLNKIASFRLKYFKNTFYKNNSAINPLYLDKFAFRGIKINPNKSVWKNLKIFGKINNNQEFCFAAVHYFLFHEIVDKKVKNLMPCEFELLKISTAMFFESIDFWIIYIDDTKISDPADIKMVRHLLHSRANDCEGLVIYTTKTGNSININGEEKLVI